MDYKLSTVFLIFAFSLEASQLAIAAPAPDSPGVVTQGQSITISGAGFGSKTTAPPELWDTVENIPSYSGLSNGQTVPVGGSNPWESQEEYCTTGAYTCVKYVTTGGDQRGKSTAVYKATNDQKGNLQGRQITATGTIYTSFWWKGSVVPTGSSKYLRLSNSSNIDTHTFSLTNYQNYIVGPSHCPETYNGYNASANQWHHIEVWITKNPQTYSVYADGVAIENSTSWTCTPFNFDYVWKVGLDGGGDPVATMTSWMDDIYVDNTLSRVMVCPGSTWSNRGKCELQPPTLWSTTSIEITANQGAIPDGGAYLYVVDSAGAVNSSGVSVTFGSGGDITAPSTTISTTDPSAISTDSLTVTGSSSDAVGVNGCRWRVGAAPSSTLGTSCTGTTSFSCSTSGYSSDANSLYVGCYDAAGNYGSDSMVVNYTPPPSTGGRTGNGGAILGSGGGSFRWY